MINFVAANNFIQKHSKEEYEFSNESLKHSNVICMSDIEKKFHTLHMQYRIAILTFNQNTYNINALQEILSDWIEEIKTYGLRDDTSNNVFICACAYMQATYTDINNINKFYTDNNMWIEQK